MMNLPRSVRVFERHIGGEDHVAQAPRVGFTISTIRCGVPPTDCRCIKAEKQRNSEGEKAALRCPEPADD